MKGERVDKSDVIISFVSYFTIIQQREGDGIYNPLKSVMDSDIYRRKMWWGHVYSDNHTHLMRVGHPLSW